MRTHFVAVQPDMKAEHYASAEAFRARIVDLAVAAVEGLDDAPKLVAFPETIALPLALSLAGLPGAHSAAGAALGALRRHPGRLARMAVRSRRAGPSLLFLLHASDVHAAYVHAFSEAARRTRATIVAGTAFLPHVERDPARGVFLAGTRVHNVAYTFGPTGMLLARTPKRHLMRQERTAGLAPGGWEQLSPIATPLGSVGVAICLDAFHDGVIERYDGMGATVVVQPSANDAPWDRRWPPDPTHAEGEAWLRYGLRAQIQCRQHVQVGVNPMLVGGFLDLQPRGRSSIVVNEAFHPGHEVEGWAGVAALAPTPSGEAFVRASIDLA